MSKFELTESQFERTVRDRIACKTHCSVKMTVLSTFLESSLNFLTYNLKNTTKFGTVSYRKKTIWHRFTTNAKFSVQCGPNRSRMAQK